MPRSKNHDLTKKTLNFRTGDWEALAELFPKQGPSVAVRKIISHFVDNNRVETDCEIEDTPDL